MSKLDAQRALREAHYARGGATPPRPGATPTQSAKKTVRTPTERPPVAPEAPAADGAETSTEALCGHKAISGRTCTREAGHSAKSHRYA
ncbi:hypothetical protein ENKNEFLB_02443 [Nocardioides aquaticus]|jgi:hypothetical protein|uniref:Uncharacterized protein n=1 Tax=Nocardioides aquaticus TaxID=160826 RepID=A0ABX8EHR7_9ACTN|nr:hypothetical protein [Nocardioides aquaticus]QVT80052.1 hypothetical protein ENKNEFLB_02443 [Nocardioides aquaticus]